LGNLESTQANTTRIRDNRKRGTAGSFLKEKISIDAKLSFVSAYFTIYAYDALKEKLDSINSLRFLFGEPHFIQTLDPEKTAKKAFRIEDDSLDLANKLEQKYVAKECADWISSKVAIKSIKKPDFLHGKMYHIDNKQWLIQKEWTESTWNHVTGCTKSVVAA
jgi:hypothetical protein